MEFFECEQSGHLRAIGKKGDYWITEGAWIHLHLTTFDYAGPNSKLLGAYCKLKHAVNAAISIDEHGFDINEVDTDTLVISGIDKNDFPDFTDAHISEAKFYDGYSLDEDQLDALTDLWADKINAYALNEVTEQAEADYFDKGEYCYQCRKEESLC